MAIPTFEWLIKNRLVKGHREAETSRFWDDLLHHYFRVEDGYSTGPEKHFGDGRADLFTAHLVRRPRLNERKFLIVECKGPGSEGQDGVWARGSDQLESYLAGIPQNSTGTYRKFGAIAVGRRVRFYELKNGELVDLEDDGTIYYLDRQCQSVTAKLEYIRENEGIRLRSS